MALNLTKYANSGALLCDSIIYVNEARGGANRWILLGIFFIPCAHRSETKAACPLYAQTPYISNGTFNILTIA